ncbi:Clp protease N-terminal domain-containing protein [Streptosporangium lutulentum]|uniref:ATP-dependent Clp protease ATP-binding subunit ClpA n=1 Tax=Streptosporangium lutulentum TaxID=1461250 RepID=A0ABT9QQK1_9ACTN|nr:Clp protease N-terminal domain-containing protein [Streptosporangium lutulentum]MDP9849045.1 ATP-dependent Clp protease ATP-binding subunit ClpA [Streptosporangium lutulentum]
MFERFHKNARQAVVLAQGNAQRLHHDRIGTEHILLGLLEQPDTVSARVLGRHGLDHDRARQSVLRLIPRKPGDALDADALKSIGIDLSAIREKVEAAFGPGALDRKPRTDRRGHLLVGHHIPFSPRAKKTLELSLREAVHLKHRHIADGHLLLGVLREGEGLASRVIADAGIDSAALRREIVTELG